MSLDGKKKKSRWGSWFRRKTAGELADEVIAEQEALLNPPRKEVDVPPPHKEVDTSTEEGAQQAAANALRADLMEWSRLREEHKNLPKDDPETWKIRKGDQALDVKIWRDLRHSMATDKKYGIHLAELRMLYDDIKFSAPDEVEFRGSF
jgi:hypothetical protein